jgi:hypothetical protein
MEQAFSRSYAYYYGYEFSALITSLHLSSTPHTAITLYFQPLLTLSLNCRINLKMQVLMLAVAQRDFGKTTPYVLNGFFS